MSSFELSSIPETTQQKNEQLVRKKGRATRTRQKRGARIMKTLAKSKKDTSKYTQGKPSVSQALKPSIVIPPLAEDRFIPDVRVAERIKDKLVVDLDNLEEVAIHGISLAPVDIDELGKIAYKIGRDSQLDDPRLGLVSNNDSCDTCTFKGTMCTGHIGIIEFEEYINHPGSVGLIEDILNCICWTCNNLIVTPQEMVRAEIIIANEHSDPKDPTSYSYPHSPYEHIKKLVTLCKAEEHCHSCSANKTKEIINETDDPLNTAIDPSTKKPKFAYIPKMSFGSTSNSNDNTASGTVGEIFFKTGVVDKESVLLKGPILPSSLIYDRFRYLRDTDVYYMGFRNKSHPKNLIMKGIVVIPKRDRPKTTTGGSIDEITRSYQSIIASNHNITNLKGMASTKKTTNGMMAEKGKLKMYVRKIICVKSSQDSRAQTKTNINEMMIGKKGTVRESLSSLRTNFSGRTVIGTNPHLNSDEVGVPESFASKLTKKETVTTENIEYLQSLVNSDKVTFIVAKVVNRLGMTETKFRRNIMSKHGTYQALVIGDVVHRHLQNGDWVVMSRQPLLTRHSRMAHKAKLVPSREAMLPLPVTGAYNADFDGDEMNMNVPQEVSESNMRAISVQRCIISDKQNAPVIGIVYDGPNAMYILTGGWVKASRRDWVNIIEIEHAFKSLGVKFPVSRDDPRITRVRTRSDRDINVDASMSRGVEVQHRISMEDTIILANQLISSLSGQPSKVMKSWQYLSPILINQKDFMFTPEEFMSISSNFYINIESEYMYERVSTSKAAEMRNKEYKDLNMKINRVLRKSIEAGILPKPPLHYLIETDEDGFPDNILNAIRMSRRLFEKIDNISSDIAYDIAWKIPGRVLFSVILPEDFNYKEYGITIIDGILVSGILTGGAIGPKPNSIVHELYNRYDTETPENLGWTAKRFIDNGSRLGDRFLTMHGITIGVKDCFPEDERKEEAEEARRQDLYKLHKNIYSRAKISNDPEERIREEEQIVRLLSSSESLTKQLTGPSNAIRLIRDSGAKGGLFNQDHILGRIGQQLYDGSRQETEYGEDRDRSSPYVMPGETAIESRGYCTSNFGTGLNEIEFITTQAVGRLDLVSTAVVTGDTGDLQRRVSKGLENIIQDQRGPAVSIATQNIYQLTYGGVALYPGHMVFDRFPEGRAASFVNLDRVVESFERKWRDVTMNDIPLDVIDEILDRFRPVIPSPVHDHSVLMTDELRKRLHTRLALFKTRINKDNAQEFIDLVVSEMVRGFNVARMPQGITIGMRAAEGVAEPATQMTLSTFHKAGSQGSVGFKNVQELVYLSPVSKKVSLVYFKPKEIHQDDIDNMRVDSINSIVQIDGKNWKFPTFRDVYDMRREFRHFVIDDVVLRLENIYYTGTSILTDGELTEGEVLFVKQSGLEDVIGRLKWYYQLSLNMRLMSIYEIDTNDIIDRIMEFRSSESYVFVTGYPEEGVIKIFIDTSKIVRIDNEDDSKVVARDYTSIFDKILTNSRLRGYQDIGEVFVEKVNVFQVYMGSRKVENGWKVYINSGKCYRFGIGWLVAVRPFILLGYDVGEYEFLEYITTEYESKILSSFVVIADSDPIVALKAGMNNQEIQNSLKVMYLGINGINNEIFTRDDISYTFSTTNDIKHTQMILGVVAARNHLFEKLWSIMDSQSGYIHPVHVQLLVDWIAFPGILSPYNERGFKNHGKDMDPMAKAMYVKGLDVFHSASNIGEDMSTSTFSTALATGQLPSIGKRYELWRKHMVKSGKIPEETTTIRKSVAVDRDDIVDIDTGVGTGTEIKDSNFLTVEESLDDITSSMYDQLLGFESSEVISEDVLSPSEYGFDSTEDNYDIDSWELEEEEEEQSTVEEPAPVVYDVPTGIDIGPMEIDKTSPSIGKFKRRAFLSAFKKNRNSGSCTRSRRRKKDK